jgi:hypothetical protein
MCYCFVFMQFQDDSVKIQGDSEVRKHTMINGCISYYIAIFLAHIQNYNFACCFVWV